MPVTYVSDDICMCKLDNYDPRADERISNSVSAILAAAFILLNLGYRKARDNMVRMRSIYKSKNITHYVGGRATAKNSSTEWLNA